MRILLITSALLSAALAPTGSAQSTGEPAPARQDPLGLGSFTKERPAGSKTEITAQKEATFDEKANRAVFTGDVRIKDPAFLLSADRLTVHLNANRSGIERAVADGNVIIVQQTSPGSTEKGAVGRARQAEYTPSTGRVVLSGRPEIQQGINLHLADSDSTRMILDRDGRATTEGPSRTVITDTSQTPLR